MKKRVVALLLSLTLVAASLTGCGKTTDSGNGGAASASTEKKADAGTSTDTGASSDELLTIEIYDEAANYQGTQAMLFTRPEQLQVTSAISYYLTPHTSQIVYRQVSLRISAEKSRTAATLWNSTDRLPLTTVAFPATPQALFTESLAR